MNIGEFQQHILTRYGQRDKERGVWPTFGWFMEEVGELASAMHGEARVNKEVEFADLFAWLLTLANIEGVAMEAALQRKYFKDGAMSDKFWEERIKRAVEFGGNNRLEFTQRVPKLDAGIAMHIPGFP